MFFQAVCFALAVSGVLCLFFERDKETLLLGVVLFTSDIFSIWIYQTLGVVDPPFIILELFVTATAAVLMAVSPSPWRATILFCTVALLVIYIAGVPTGALLNRAEAGNALDFLRLAAFCIASLAGEGGARVIGYLADWGPLPDTQGEYAEKGLKHVRARARYGVGLSAQTEVKTSVDG